MLPTRVISMLGADWRYFAVFRRRIRSKSSSSTRRKKIAPPTAPPTIAGSFVKAVRR